MEWTLEELELLVQILGEKNVRKLLNGDVSIEFKEKITKTTTIITTGQKLPLVDLDKIAERLGAERMGSVQKSKKSK
ncbi:MAG: hypothetical protein CO137_02440 [Candidatus Magasanikbacteria bacterium CG_4_9_14_3_um_filter_32_9]|uniref:Uncharacterized protein n=1 Tax=Candidatus Magasanikbacteria bacterium CG_4_9_14_3_um_filter_32_9 TaxID=1974644 RepID=A0A2M7Z6K1_9BACT|nr:MAG: hypothetical protein CO137_02440 [Candidatus Magasanikbacteria bacterium CG_4_9_14_3_um_filter_32_9]